MNTRIPYRQIETLFLDAGNTLVAIHFDWISMELEDIGVSCAPEQLLRAEAAARPIISAQAQEFQQRDRYGVYEFYATHILSQLPVEVIPDQAHIPGIIAELVPRLLERDNTQKLWSYVLPGVREALEQFAAKGLQLVVVSNSNGTVEELLTELQLRSYFDVVIDSHVVQVEKPDPEIFRIALNRSGAVPERTIHVGDLYNVDVLGARSAGLHALLLDPYSDWPELDCESVPDLLALSEKLVHDFVTNYT